MITWSEVLLMTPVSTMLRVNSGALIDASEVRTIAKSRIEVLSAEVDRQYEVIKKLGQELSDCHAEIREWRGRKLMPQRGFSGAGPLEVINLSMFEERVRVEELGFGLSQAHEDDQELKELKERHQGDKLDSYILEAVKPFLQKHVKVGKYNTSTVYRLGLVKP